MTRLRAALRRVRRQREGGLTLVELVVSMALLGIFLTIFTGAILTMYRSTNRSEALADSAAQLSAAFHRLDGSIRYAAAIAPPVTGTDGNPYVAFQTTYTGTQTCTQLRVDLAGHQLQWRTWTVSSGAAAGLSSWAPLASEVVEQAAGGTAVAPFTLTQPGGLPHQQLRVRLAAVSGNGAGNTATSDLDLTLVAFNTTADTTGDGVCQEVGTP